MNIVVPLAGKDKNFEDRGLCKPLVEVAGKHTIEWIAESRPFSYKSAIFILLREHQKRYALDSKLRNIFGENIRIIWAEEPTGGAPQSVLLAKDIINNDEELIIDLPDQYLDSYGLMEFLNNNSEYDGLIPTFKSSYWNRGYMLLDKEGFVSRVSEKDRIPISNDSTACISYFKRGRDFVCAAEEMIRKKRTASNGAYLISLAYNEMIEKGMKIRTYPCQFISTLGTLEGVSAFEQHLRPLRRKKLDVISHRATNSKYPENSLPSIRWAFKSGYGVEIDLRVNKEGSLVVIHDEDGKRLFNNPKKIIDMNNEECKSLVYMGYEISKVGLCFFEDVCKSYSEIGKKVTVALHIKNIFEPSVVEKTISLLRKYKMQDYSFLFAVDDQALALTKHIKKSYPDIKVGLHLPENSHLFTEENFKETDIVWLDEETGSSLTSKISEMAKKTNTSIYCMSPEFVPNNIFRDNYRKRWEDILKMNFDAIVTDHADELKEFLEKANQSI